jgi:hypothetical protein
MIPDFCQTAMHLPLPSRERRRSQAAIAEWRHGLRIG